jgi:phosphopantetheinyl transferase (holo-ACP synthase)
MSTQITLEYLSKLLNKPMTEEVEVMLSSAQKARVHGWLINNDISFKESVLNGKFTINQLLSSGSNGIVHIQPSSLNHSSPLAQLDVGNAQIGIDIQRVDELFPQGLSFDPKSDKELIQIFTTKELSYAQAKVDPEVTLTGIFCAKEAIQKASRVTKNLNEIEVLPDEFGRPKCNGFILSISHTGNLALGVAITSIDCSLGQKTLGFGANNPLKISTSEPIINSKPSILKIRIMDLFIIGALLALIYFK